MLPCLSEAELVADGRVEMGCCSVATRTSDFRKSLLLDAQWRSVHEDRAKSSACPISLARRFMWTLPIERDEDDVVVDDDDYDDDDDDDDGDDDGDDDQHDQSDDGHYDGDVAMWR